MTAEGGQVDEAGVLRRLLAMVMAPPSPSAWASPPRAQIEAAATAYLLLDPGGAARFVPAGLEQLARELTRSSAQRTVSGEEGVRGRVLWAATLAARAERGDGGHAFVYREVRHRYDTPENQLLRYTADRLAEGLERLPAALRGALCYTPATGALERAAAAERLERAAAALGRARASAGLRAVTPPARVGPLHLLRAETARNEGYAALARVYRLYAELTAPGSWRAALGRIGRRTLVLPAGAGPEADLWLELAAMALRGGAG